MQSTDPTYPLFPIFAFLGFILTLVPFPWHLQAWNAGTCIFMIWASFSSLIQFVDSLIWRGNMINSAPVWCDISTKFLIGAGVGIPAASACISRRLYKIASTSYVTVSARERRKALWIDIAIGVGIPVIVMALHYIVQGHRFNILQDIGCVPTIYNTPPAYPLVYMWPPLLACVSFVYSGLTLRAFWVRRMQFRDIIATSKSMTVSRYFRLLLLACIDMVFNVPLTVLNMWINNDGVRMDQWVSWSNTHYQFSHVQQIPAFIWRSNLPFHVSAELGRWIFPCCGLIFFMLFGFAEEARRHYRMWFWAVANCFGYLKPEPRAPKQPIPSFVHSKSVDTDVLPPYSLPTFVSQERFDTKGDALDLDLEKAVTSPSSTTMTLSTYDNYPTPSDTAFSFNLEKDLPSPTFSETSAAHIVISDAHPASRPSSPSLVVSPITPLVPAYHRPFSPPTVCPVDATNPYGFHGGIMVTVQTE